MSLSCISFSAAFFPLVFPITTTFPSSILTTGVIWSIVPANAAAPESLPPILRYLSEPTTAVSLMYFDISVHAAAISDTFTPASLNLTASLIRRAVPIDALLESTMYSFFPVSSSTSKAARQALWYVPDKSEDMNIPSTSSPAATASLNTFMNVSGLGCEVLGNSSHSASLV